MCPLRCSNPSSGPRQGCRRWDCVHGCCSLPCAFGADSGNGNALRTAPCSAAGGHDCGCLLHRRLKLWRCHQPASQRKCGRQGCSGWCCLLPSADAGTCLPQPLRCGSATLEVCASCRLGCSRGGDGSPLSAPHSLYLEHLPALLVQHDDPCYALLQAVGHLSVAAASIKASHAAQA